MITLISQLTTKIKVHKNGEIHYVLYEQSSNILGTQLSACTHVTLTKLVLLCLAHI